MKLAISNIAWSPSEANPVYELMNKYQFAGLEIAPGLLFPGENSPFTPSDVSIKSVKETLKPFQISLVSMQSLHFGVSDAFLFGNDQERANFSDSIGRAITLASRLGLSNLVVGSPKNRVVPDTISQQEAWKIAKNEFCQLADMAEHTGQTLAIEPNPSDYGTNFLTNINDVIEFVEFCEHTSIRINFDTGALHMNNQAAAASDLFKRARNLVSHVHISEPFLGAVPSNQEWLADFSSTLTSEEYTGWVSIEMRRAEENTLAIIESSLASLRSNFPDT